MRLALKFALISSGKTQRAVAAETQIGEVRLSDIIRGRRMPTVDERARLARALGQSELNLFDGDCVTQSYEQNPTVTPCLAVAHNPKVAGR